MQGSWPVVLCPGCNVPMNVKEVATDDRLKQTGRVIYLCEICKTETERPYKGPELADLAPST